MGPRLFRRGNTRSLSILRLISFCFNGATSFQTWKPGSTPKTRCGRSLLQWGHVFSDVETWVKLASNNLFRIASMGPRLFRRGNLFCPEAVRISGEASMGPRLFRRGNVRWNAAPCASSSGFNGATSFQTWKLHYFE